MTVTPRDMKARLRNERLALRDAMPVEARIEASLAMADLAGERLAFDPGTVISGFWPIRSEADIRPLLAKLADRGARLCLPVVLDRETIVFRELVRGAPVIKTGFGTTGPGPEAAELDPAILFVPLSAFDAAGHRIGYGAGHYDYTFAHLRKAKPVIGVGLAFAVQEIKAVPALSHDVALDYVLTEKKVFDFRS